VGAGFTTQTQDKNVWFFMHKKSIHTYIDSQHIYTYIHNTHTSEFNTYIYRHTTHTYIHNTHTSEVNTYIFRSTIYIYTYIHTQHTYIQQGTGTGFTTQTQDKDVWFVSVLTVTDGRAEFRMATPADQDQQSPPSLSVGGSQQLVSWSAKKLARGALVGARSVEGGMGNVLAMEQVCVCMHTCIHTYV
jgi:hypothetical protein